MNMNFFKDNTLSFDDTFNNEENQLILNIKEKRGKTVGALGYTHKDGTKVIFGTSKCSDDYDRDGYDIILTRGKNYIHFETIADNNSNSGKLNISIGQMGNREDSQCSYPMSHPNHLRYRDSHQEIRNILADNQPSLAKIYETYVPSDFRNLYIGILQEVEDKREEQKESKNNAAFMKALNNWKNTKTQ